MSLKLLFALLPGFYRRRHRSRHQETVPSSPVLHCESLERRLALAANVVAEIESNNSFGSPQSLSGADQ